MNAYLDNNIIVSVENGEISIEDMKHRIDNSITDIYYSSAHIGEAEEISGISEVIRSERINKRIEPIKRTNSDYLYLCLEMNKVVKKGEPEARILQARQELARIKARRP